YFKTKDDLVASLIDEMTGARSLVALLDARPAGESPFRALRNLMRSVVASSEELDEERASKRRLHAKARADRLLWSAYLRSNYDFADQLAESFHRRRPAWSERTALIAAHAAVGALEAVLASLPPEATAEDWVAD